MIKEGGLKNPAEKLEGQTNHSTGVFKSSDKPKRYGEDALNKSLLAKKVRVTLINGKTIEGILTNVGMYDLSVTIKEQQRIGALIKENDRIIIVLKASIATVEVVP